MKKNYFAFALMLIAATILSACNLGTNQAGDVSVEPTPIITQTLGAIQQDEAERSSALTAESAPTFTPTAILLPTQIPTNTPLPTFTPVPANQYTWVDDAWDIVYSNETNMTSGMTFEGPAVCEWWDQEGFDFKATFDPVKNTINVIELHEAMFPLMVGESYTYPVGYVGKCWTIEGGNTAVATLMSTFRHILFFSNVHGNDSAEIKSLKAEGKIWEGVVVDGKAVHAYMHIWLEVNGFGLCNFRDQTSCAILALIVVQPPLGTSIEK